MKIERGFTQSRVARRIVALFVLCALVPIAATALLSYDHVRKLWPLVRQTNSSWGSSLSIEIWRIISKTKVHFESYRRRAPADTKWKSWSALRRMRNGG